MKDWLPLLPSRQPELRKLGFSLIEVVIAIGIVSFAMMAILGLFSVGLQSNRESAEDTTLALMSQQMNAWSRSQPFTNLTASNTVFFFNAGGELTRTANGDPATTAGIDSHYSCTISPQTNSVSTNLIYLQSRYEWPLSAPSTGRQQRVIVASRANEE